MHVGCWQHGLTPACADYYLSSKRPKVNRRKLWGVPTSEKDMYVV